ncbi:MAG: M1 family metallopeptidase [Labilithrix sp.]|nr:M1 family metallopeptidase [Labilithrix sp.]MBX3220177.1 M1 family metallopeptidase [Labilithrix sp.]
MRARALAFMTFLGAATSLAADGPLALAGPPGADDAAPDVEMAAHAPNVASYTLRAKLDPTRHTVHGEGTITWRNASSKAVSELWMHLYLNAFKNQSSVFMRAPIGGFRGGHIPSEWGSIDLKRLVLVDGETRHDLLPTIELRRPGDEDETDARVPLPREVAPGAEIALEVEWDDKLPNIVERTGYDGSFHMVGQWFPKIAKLEADGSFAHFPFHHLGEFYADYGTYDVTIDVPDDFIVGATGPVTETRREGGRLVERHVQGDIHDFAWTAWDGYRVKKETIHGVDVTVLAPAGYDDHVERELETMRFALPHYGARYGKYPYPVLTLVHPPVTASEAGGMEYPTLITTGQPSWLPRGLWFVEGVTIHEFGHQYFYGLLASNEDAWPFLDEGLNSYAENEAMAAWKGAGSGIHFAGLTIGDVEAQAERARHFGHDEKIAQGAGAFATGSAYGALVYSRTAALLETIARAYGKAKMDRALGVYARRFRFRHPTPNDLIDTIRAEIGPGAADNLRAGLFDKGWVDYTITQTSSHPSHGAAGMFDRDGKRETISPDKTARPNRYDGSVLVVRRGTLRFPVEIELVATDGSRSRVTWDGEAESFRVPYSGSAALRSAIVDPDDRILLDEHPQNNFATAPGQATAGAPRVLERGMFWAATLLGGLAP